MSAIADAAAQFRLAAALDEQGRHEDALAQLRGAAKAGHVPAMTRLGKRLLVGENAPFAPQEGMALLTNAVERGDAEAMAQMATLAGAGAWMPQSWTVALNLLQESAKLGREDARGQLLLLAADRPLADRIRGGVTEEPECWRPLRESVNIEAWLAQPGRRQVCDTPRIWVSEDFTTPDICDWLVAKARGKFKPARLFDGKKSSFSEARTCSDFVFDIVAGDLILLLVRARIAALTALPTFAMEPPQIFHYALGQEIKPHFDFLYDGKHGYGQADGYQGDRLATFLLYLNHDYGGGELEFPRVGFRYKAKAGDAIYFANKTREGASDRLSLHAALPITRGEKYIFSQWIHDRAFTA